MKNLLPFLLIIGAVIVTKKDSQNPRGYRNKNPGNLKLSEIKWNGKIPNHLNTDGTFEQFSSDYYGIRAAALDVVNDIKKDGLDTVRKLITEYAPSNENKTCAYISAVSKMTGLAPDQKIPLTTSAILGIMKAIFKVENGFNKYTDMQIIAAVDGGAGVKYGLS